MEEPKSKNKLLLVICILLGICVGIGLVLAIQYFNKDTEYVILSESENESEKTIEKEVINKKPVDTVRKQPIDTVSIDTNLQLNTSYNAGGSEEIIEQDVLLASKTIQLPATNENELDSLLIDDKTPVKNILQIEFWRSPINYTGYRMNANKLVLFGFYEPAEVSFTYSEKGILMEYKQNSFLLQNTENFKPLHIKRTSSIRK